MSSLWVPPAVSLKMREQTEFNRDEVMRSAVRDKTLVVLTEELKRIDSYLELIKAHDNAQVPGLRPGYWHIIRNHPDAPVSILPLVGDNGEFVEPSSKILQLLREGDLQNPSAMRARVERDEEAERQRLRQKERETEDRQLELTERWKAATQVSVSMTDSPWGQTAKAASKQRAQKKAEA